MRTRILTIILSLIFALTSSAQKFEGLAMTPPMGWNSWNKFQCEINEDMIRQMADAMVVTGMRDVGYEYLVIDDCWHGQRDSLGLIHPDPDRFPSGMKALADYIHAKGLKFGIYSDAGNTTCAGYPGSRGHEYQDAKTYASWGIDYLKYDWCDTEGLTGIGAYTTMSQALKDTGRPIIFSLCDWGHNAPWEWASEVGHLWRTTGDIYNCWDCENSHGDWSSWGILKILDMHREFDIRKYQGPGHYNDPDMLQVGNGMSVNEDRSHFSIWAMLSAPLISGNDLRNMSRETLEILTNSEVLAVNQDKLAIQAFRYQVKGHLEIWFKPMDKDKWAVMFLNRGDVPVEVSFNWKDHVVSDKVFNRQADFSKTVYQIRDVWAKKDQGTTSQKVTITVPGRDVWMVTLQPTK
jgi:alpha-galactosidase